jgi:hypothetical protein
VECGGNHDLNFEAPDSHYSRVTYKRVFGANYYAFEYANTLSLCWTMSNVLAQIHQPRRAGRYRGFFGQRQLAFIANVLKETPATRLVAVFMHIPLRNYLDANDPTTNVADRAEFLALLAGRIAVSFSGHTHATEHHYFGPADGFNAAPPHHHHVLTAASGSWWSGPLDRRGIASADSRDGTPHGFHILSVDDGEYTTRFVAANEPNARQMRISVDADFHFGPDLFRDFRTGQIRTSPLSKDQLAAAALLVNAFDGGPKIYSPLPDRHRQPNRNETRSAPRSLRSGSVCPQPGDNQAMGQSRTIVTYLDRASSCNSGTRGTCDRRPYCR